MRRRRFRLPDRHRYRRRDGRQDGQGVHRTFLHDQAAGQGVGAGPVDGPWPGGAVGRLDEDRDRAGAGYAKFPSPCRSPSRARRSKPATVRREIAPASRPYRILLVEDDVLVALGVTAVLEDMGHQVTRALDGAQALSILNSGEAFDLMITDYAMPGMTGLELAHAVKASWPTLPVVLATGYAELPTGSAPIGLNRLFKPFRPADLAELMAEILERRRSARQSPRFSARGLSEGAQAPLRADAVSGPAAPACSPSTGCGWWRRRRSSAGACSGYRRP